MPAAQTARCIWPMSDIHLDFDRAIIQALADLPRLLEENHWAQAGDPTGWRTEEGIDEHREACLYLVADVPVHVLPHEASRSAGFDRVGVGSLRPTDAQSSTDMPGAPVRFEDVVPASAVFTTPDVCKLAGISLRQLDYWTSQGWIQAHGEAHPGTGQKRAYRGSEVHVAAIAKRLLDLGVAIRAATAIARQAVDTGQPVELAGGLIRIDPAKAVA